MASIVAEWSGCEREFTLTFGGVLDVEAACDSPIGEIFLRVSSGRFSANDVYHVIRLALIGGGEGLTSSKLLMEKHFDTRPYLDNAQLAGDILIAVMAGVEADKTEDGGKEPSKYKFSELAQICQVFHLSPLDIRNMRYADFVNMMNGYNAASKANKLQPISEEEFEDILARYEPEVMNDN